MNESEQVKQTLLGKPYPVYCTGCQTVMYMHKLKGIFNLCDFCKDIQYKRATATIEQKSKP